MFWHHSRERGMYRAWWHYGRHSAHCSSIEVSWGRTFCHLTFGLDDERGLGFSIALPPVALWLHIGLPFLHIRESRTIQISIHSFALWWTMWRDPMGGWSSDVPKWREGSFHFNDFLLGKSKCSTKVLEERNIIVPMPEGPYPAEAKLVEYSWSRSRWFTKRLKRVQIEIAKGIPHAGKGENSWDCGDDATFGITTGECHSIPEGVGILVGSVLHSRVRYGGWGDYVWSRPDRDEVTQPEVKP